MLFFLFNDTATTEIYTLSLHDALPISLLAFIDASEVREEDENFKNAVDYIFEALEKEKPNHFAVKQYKKYKLAAGKTAKRDRKSTRLNSSHANISYAVFCLKKKTKVHLILILTHPPRPCASFILLLPPLF